MRWLLFLPLLILASGCQLNRSLVPLSLLGSEWGRQGIAAIEQGDLPKAEKLLDHAVRISKNDTNHRIHYAEVLWRQKKYQESLQQLNEAVKRGGHHNAALHISLAQKYLEIQRFDAACRHADEAVRLNEHDDHCWALHGKVKRYQAAYEENPERKAELFDQAREDLLRAVSLAPDDKELLPELATVQMNCGQPEQALATWIAAQNRYPHGGEPDEVLIGKTETLTLLHRFDEARACLWSINQRGPEYAETEKRLHAMIAATQHETRR